MINAEDNHKVIADHVLDDVVFANPVLITEDREFKIDSAIIENLDLLRSLSMSLRRVDKKVAVFNLRTGNFIRKILHIQKANHIYMNQPQHAIECLNEIK